MVMRIALMTEMFFRFGRTAFAEKGGIMIAYAILIPLGIGAAVGALWLISLGVARVVAHAIDKFMNRW